MSFSWDLARYNSVSMSTPAAQLAQQHWNETPLFLSESERYGIYPWLPRAAEFSEHRGERVLEIGCGTGCDLLQFARNGAHAVGVDITDQHLELARQRVIGEATVLKADGANLPFPAESFDYIYSHGVIHHSDRPRAIVEEIFRVLKPDGRFNIQLYAAHSYNLWHCKRESPNDWRIRIENSIAAVHIDFYSARAARDLVASARQVRVRKRHCWASVRGHDISWLSQRFGWLLGYYVIVTGKRP
jgi:ubiquinone/menaquinone biosynthesis C-methylase UbiE